MKEREKERKNNDIKKHVFYFYFLSFCRVEILRVYQSVYDGGDSRVRTVTVWRSGVGGGSRRRWWHVPLPLPRPTRLTGRRRTQISSAFYTRARTRDHIVYPRETTTVLFFISIFIIIIFPRVVAVTIVFAQGRGGASTVVHYTYTYIIIYKL